MPGKLEETNEVLSSYGKHRAVPVGEVSLSCRMKERTTSLDFYVVDLESVPIDILGLEAYTRFSLVRKTGNLNVNLSPREAILYDYKHIFEGLGCMPQEYHIEIQQDATPVAHTKYLLAFNFVWTLVT